jgi:hypothetical protein
MWWSVNRTRYHIICVYMYNWATLFLGEYKYEDLVLQVEGVSNETVKYGLGPAELGPQSDCSGKAQKQL